MRRDERRVRVLLGLFVLTVTSFRLWFASSLGVAPDEAYYFEWSKALSLVYRDHPPMVAWAMRLGVWALGETPLGLRLVAVLLSAAAVFGVYSIGMEMRLSLQSALVGAAVSTLLVAPASAAVICTPDTFLGAFTILAVLALLRFQRTRAPVWIYVFSVACALCLWSKHSAVSVMCIPVIVALFTWFRKGIRCGFTFDASRHIGGDNPLGVVGGDNPLGRCSRGLYAPVECDDTAGDKPLGYNMVVHGVIAFCIGALLIAPYILAEASAGFPAISLQTAHLTGGLPGSEEKGPLIVAARFGEVIGGQIGLLSPLVAGFLIVYFVSVRTETSLLLKTAVLLPIAATFSAALFTHPEQNWAALGHPMAGPMIIFAMEHRFQDRPKRLRPWTAATVASVIIVFVVIHVHSLYPFLPLSPERDPTSRLHGWNALFVLNARLEKVDAVVCDNYGLAAEVDWQLRHELAAGMVVASPDRGTLPSPGDWLLLSQDGDFGREKLDVRCDDTKPQGSIALERKDGESWDRVSVSIGRNCR